MNKYLIATALILGTVANPIMCGDGFDKEYGTLKAVATTSTLSAIVGGGAMIAGYGTEGAVIAFGGTGLSIIVGVAISSVPTIVITGVCALPAIAVLGLAKLCMSMTSKGK